MARKALVRYLLFFWIFALSAPSIASYCMEDYSIIITVNNNEEENSETVTVNLNEEKLLTPYKFDFHLISKVNTDKIYTRNTTEHVQVLKEILLPPPEPMG